MGEPDKFKKLWSGLTPMTPRWPFESDPARLRRPENDEGHLCGHLIYQITGSPRLHVGPRTTVRGQPIPGPNSPPDQALYMCFG